MIFVRFFITLAASWFVFISPAVAKTTCTKALQAQLARLQTQVKENPNASYQVERLALRCQGVDAVTARFVAQVNVDLRIAGRQLANRKISVHRYLVLLADRRIKLENFLSDPCYRRAYARGDDDRDPVPNRQDRCRNSPRNAMTDERGCEYDCENFAASRSSLVTADQCRLLQPPGTGLEGLRQVMNTKIPFNPACESAPTPTATSPLGWTRIVLESGRIPPTTTYEARGLKLFVVRSSNPAPGCELFYEFDLRFNEVSGVKSTSMLFSSREDASPSNSDIATFIMRTVRQVSTPAPQGPFSATALIYYLPLSAGRAIARDGFANNTEVFWRVRAINGLGSTSGWSEFRKHPLGPDLTP